MSHLDFSANANKISSKANSTASSNCVNSLVQNNSAVAHSQISTKNDGACSCINVKKCVNIKSCFSTQSLSNLHGSNDPELTCGDCFKHIRL